MAQHTLQDLKIKQALPLEIKVNMTKARIRAWVDHFGLDGVYVSFSGGKDSTVLLHIAREIYPGIKAVFVDTGLEYPEIRNFVKGFDNVEWIRPKLTFKQVIEKYGYPFISKEVAECVQGARKYLTELDKSGKLVRAEQSRAEQSRAEQSRAEQSVKYAYFYDKLCGVGRYAQSENAESGRRGEREVADPVGSVTAKDDEGDYP